MEAEKQRRGKSFCFDFHVKYLPENYHETVKRKAFPVFFVAFLVTFMQFATSFSCSFQIDRRKTFVIASAIFWV